MDMYYSCAQCAVKACESGELDKKPKNCPMHDAEFFEKVLEEYKKEENSRFYQTSSAIEALGYCRWPRLREIAEFCKRMGYKRIGIAFCGGLPKEAEIVANVLRKQGFEVVSVICKTGAIPKPEAGVTADVLTDINGNKIEPSDFQREIIGEVMCNPIAQAELLNRAETEFNICLGLCVGHDSLFYQYSKARVTTLVAKDRVTGHNPVAAIYCADTYFKNRNIAGSD